jgi:hypothetical protein
MTETFLRDLRDQVKAFTEADPYFDGIEILNERLKDLSAKIDERLAIIGGLCIVLVTPVVGGVLQNVRGANFTGIKIVGRILENVDLNETGKEALDVAVYLAALWSQSKPDTLASSMTPDEPTISLGNDPKYLSYDVAFTVEAGASIAIPRLAAPVLDAGDLDAVTLSNPVAGAAIFRTLDGSAPVPRNPAATLVQGPFIASSGQTLRARAWLAGYIASPETTKLL